MKTAVFSPCYVDEPYRLIRHEKWLEYMFALKDTLKFDAIYLIDNASNIEILKQLGGTIYDEQWNILHIGTIRPALYIVRCEKHYERKSWNIYHYWWRAMFYGWNHIREKFEYEKMIHIDTDMFILSQKLVDYLNNVNTGFTSFWCSLHKCPETTFHFLCKDSFNIVDEFIKNTKDYSQYDCKDAEHIVPFSFNNKDFYGDRWGEKGLTQTKDMDYYGQASNETILKFNL